MFRRFRFITLAVLVALSVSVVSCTKEEEAPPDFPSTDLPPYPTYPDVTLDCSGVADTLSADPNAASKPSAIVIPFKISQSMNSYIGTRNPSWPTSLGPPVCTSLSMKEKINKIFQLYGSDPRYNVRFQYAGTYKTFKRYSEAPKDGTIYVNLTHGAGGYGVADTDLIQANTGLISGDWGPPNSRNNSTGAWVTTYPGGIVSLMELDYSFSYLIHEIGHALGLAHGPMGSTVMSAGPSFDLRVEIPASEEYLAYGEQDRVNIAATAPASGHTPMQISGKVTSSPAIGEPTGEAGTQQVYVYAVNVVNGLTYFAGAISDSGVGNWKFSLNVTAGTYKVFAIKNEMNASLDPTNWSPSWWVSSSGSTLNPASATAINVSSGSPTTSNLIIPMIYTPTPFYLKPLSHHFDFGDGVHKGTGHPYFMSPGSSIVTYLSLNTKYTSIGRNQQINSLETFGSAPDYTISNFQKMDVSGIDGYIYYFTLAVSSSAVPGDRLVVAKAASGNTVYGLIGISVDRSSTKPSYVLKNFPDQLTDGFDFTTLNPNYWK